MIRVLIIEDERKVARFIQKGLAAEGMEATVAETGEDGLRLAMEPNFDVITVDLALPRANGFDVIRALRERGSAAAILVLSARGALPDKLLGFGAGADDYLAKPFAFDELVVRIRALARRSALQMEPLLLRYADIEMDLRTRRVRRSGHEIELTTTEFNLLELFLRHPEESLSRARIVEGVWREQFDRETNVIEVYIMYLRKKLSVMPNAPHLLHTIRGVGYRLREMPEKE